ncbi:HNH endonuclease [Desulfobacterales bacterium HSG16]|nr:HNH endonuclease [Desulfobacterales bacterium HSG16]
MSFHKCFYCEQELGETEGQVDHYVEVAEKPERAFEWNNLYLSCPLCNGKKSYNIKIPVSDCLDPCDISENPSAHLSFDDEHIIQRQNSVKGAKTIQKYKLNRRQLRYLRLKQLQRFERFLRKLLERKNREGRKEFTLLEKEAILRFKEPHHAFSLMFNVYLSGIEF